MKRPQKLAVMLVPTPPYEICGLVALTAAITKWHKMHRDVQFDGLHACPILGYVTISEGGEPEPLELPNGGRFDGTLIGMVFHQKRVENYAELLHSAKISAGLLPEGGQSGKFTP